MKTTTTSLLLTALLCSTAQAQPIESILYRGGLGTPVSDHQLLTVSHLGIDPDTSARDPKSDLVLIDYAPGTFTEWATISFDWPAVGDGVTVAVRREAGVHYESQEVEQLRFGRFIVTDPLLRGGDSGGGVFDGQGNLVGVNYAFNPSTRDSYHLAMAASADWLRANVTMTPVPEPGTIALLLIGLGAMAWRYRK